MLHFSQWNAVQVLSDKVCKIGFLNMQLVCMAMCCNIQLAKESSAF